MAEVCYTPIFICAIRAARLTAGGGFVTGANNLWESSTIMSLGVQPQSEAGTRLNPKTGCDTTCVTYEGDDRQTFDALTLELCQLELGLLEILTGGTVITDGGDIVGFERRDPSAGAYPGASLEVWAKAWDSDQQAVDGVDDPLYYRFAWPRTTWIVGSMTFGNDITRIPLTGKGKANSGFGTGPLGDWPTAISQPGAVFLDTAIPDGECGYQLLAS